MGLATSNTSLAPVFGQLQATIKVCIFYLASTSKGRLLPRPGAAQLPCELDRVR